MSNKLKYPFYLSSYSLLLSVIIAVFFILRPFSYIDNDRSNLICLIDKTINETGSNMIFMLDEHLNKPNDIKARKLCKYKIIRDYNNTYQTPTTINYTLIPKVAYESSWLNDIFICIVLFIFSSVIIESGWRFMCKRNSAVWNRIRDLVVYVIQ